MTKHDATLKKHVAPKREKLLQQLVSALLAIATMLQETSAQPRAEHFEIHSPSKPQNPVRSMPAEAAALPSERLPLFEQ